MATTYCINTTLVDDGSTYQVDYWPDGDGQEWPGYVSSFPQYCAELNENLSDSRLNLYVVTSAGKAKLVSDDDELKRAVDSLPDRGVLSVNAVARSGTGRNRPYRYEWEAKEVRTGRWYDEDWEDASEDDGFYATEGETYGVETKRNRVHAMLERFGASSYSSCYHCGASEWKGAKYDCAWNSDYSVCSSCYKQMSKSDKEDWQSTEETPWTSDAPQYPLYREEDLTVRPEVCHLQYILTRLGYMPLSATEQVVGSFQSNTENGVRRFREHYGIRGGNMGVYNEKTAKKLAQVVKRCREAGHKYL